MKKLLVCLLFLPLLCSAQTGPDWTQIKNAPMIDIRRYGAITSGVITTQIRAHLASTDSDKMLYIPEGTYTMDVASAPNDEFHITGAGIGKTIIYGLIGSRLFDFRMGGNSYHNYLGNMTLKPYGMAATACIELNEVSYSVFENLHIDRPTGSGDASGSIGIYLNEECYYNLFQNVKIERFHKGMRTRDANGTVLLSCHANYCQIGFEITKGNSLSIISSSAELANSWSGGTTYGVLFTEGGQYNNVYNFRAESYPTATLTYSIGCTAILSDHTVPRSNVNNSYYLTQDQSLLGTGFVQDNKYLLDKTHYNTLVNLDGITDIPTALGNLTLDNHDSIIVKEIATIGSAKWSYKFTAANALTFDLIMANSDNANTYLSSTNRIALTNPIASLASTTVNGNAVYNGEISYTYDDASNTVTISKSAGNGAGLIRGLLQVTGRNISEVTP